MNQYEIVAQAGRLAQLARANGLVLTISQQPLLPLAMGNHADLCDVRPLRGAPEPSRQGPWISVKDRLPEKCKEVMIFFAGQCTLASTGQYTGGQLDTNGWCYPIENKNLCDNGSDPIVTHWMPLPEPPTE